VVNDQAASERLATRSRNCGVSNEPSTTTLPGSLNPICAYVIWPAANSGPSSRFGVPAASPDGVDLLPDVSTAISLKYSGTPGTPVDMTWLPASYKRPMNVAVVGVNPVTVEQ
jgi:hypothetical protein